MTSGDSKNYTSLRRHKLALLRGKTTDKEREKEHY